MGFIIVVLRVTALLPLVNNKPLVYFEIPNAHKCLVGWIKRAYLVAEESALTSHWKPAD